MFISITELYTFKTNTVKSLQKAKVNQYHKTNFKNGTNISNASLIHPFLNVRKTHFINKKKIRINIHCNKNMSKSNNPVNFDTVHDI